MKRAFITALAIGIAAGFVILVIVGGPGTPEDAAPTSTADANDGNTPPVAVSEPNRPSPAPDVAAGDAPPATQQQPRAAALAEPAPLPPATRPAVESTDGAGFVVVPTDPQPVPTIGSTADADNRFMMQVRFTPWNAGIKSLKLSRYSEVVGEHVPYELERQLPSGAGAAGKPTYVYPLGANLITINGQIIDLRYARWKVTTNPDARANGGQAGFELMLADANAGDPNAVVTLRRTYTLDPNSYDLRLDQRIVNQTGRPVSIEYVQYGQGDLPVEGGYMGDRRTAVLGYFRPEYDPSRRVYIAGMQRARRELLDADSRDLWPALDKPVEERIELAYAAMTNRYFMTALHRPAVGTPNDPNAAPRVPQLDQTFPFVQHQAVRGGEDPPLVLLMHTGKFTLAPGGERDLDLALFAGPKDPDLIEGSPLYSSLGLDKLIIYNIGGCCSFLTFSWLSHGLLAFLKLLHSGLMDWGLAIIVLVIVVRALLHPITKRSQINMMKFGKQMQTLQPEMERLKRKHKDNQQKLNQEMMKLYKDKGVNPAAMGMGCLPMFLQMPIWIALYAMLFFAIELRHEPAFYDIFHKLGASLGLDWSFLRDLSSPDRFIMLPESVQFTVPLVDMEIVSLNVIPVLMAVVFLIQQKFMRPPTEGQISEQAAQQQKMMKFMTLLFPLFLYNAPAGLTLYILASTGSGILDSYLVRKHIQQQEAEGQPITQAKEPKKGGFMDRMRKAAEAKRAQVDQQRQRLEGGGGSKHQQSRRRRKR